MILADTSAWILVRRDPALRPKFDAQVAAGDIATCDPVKLELLRGARNPGDFGRNRQNLDRLPLCPAGPAEWRRAMDVYQALCFAGPGNDAHRRVGHPDLLIAAAAESAGVPVLHYDHHFDLIAGITGQPAEWIAPRGSVV